MREHKGQIVSVQGQSIAMFVENPILKCRCVKGQCMRKGCHAVKTENHGLACHVMDRFNESVEFVPSAHYENRADILNGVLFDKSASLEFQDNLFLTITESRKHKKDQWERYLRSKDCKVNPSGKYNRGSAKWRAQRVIEEALTDYRADRKSKPIDQADATFRALGKLANVVRK